jgi:DNA-binding winged helix-turn-helix (wHTH) protein/tetratricopeptide (TPR) repeat protein
VIYTFDDFELDAERRTLRRKGESIRIESRPLDLLTYLVENHGRLVTKQELAEVVWKGAAVSRSTLPITLHAARRAIGQEQGDAKPLTTVGRQGYTFSGEVSVAEAESTQAITRANPFVGRTEVMGELTRMLSDSRAGQVRIGLLTGEPGIGKSRAARELASVARQHGITAWTAHSMDGGGAVPYCAWKPILGISLESLSERQLGTMIKGGLPPEIDRLFPEVASYLSRYPRLPAVSSAAARHRLHETLARLVVGPPSTRARLIVLEDLQWADSASIELLLHLTAYVGEARLLVIGTLRDQDIPANDTRYELMHQLFRAPAARRISLTPLSAADVAQFVAHHIKRDDSARIAATIHEKTQGNPFFVEETIRWLQSEEANGSRESRPSLDSADLPVPDAVRVLIRRRLRVVSAPTQELLTIAAVIGTEFDLSLLQHAAGGDGPDPTTQLEEAAAARLISIDARGGAAGRFVHVLIRETIYQDLPAASRAATHLRIAELLEKEAGPDPERLLNSLALHYYRSLPKAAEKAFTYCLRAARATHSVLAFEQARMLYEHALEAWAFQAESKRDHALRCATLLGLAHCLLSTPRLDERPLVADGIRLARVIGRPDLLALGVVLANVYTSAGHPVVESLREVTEEALNLLPEGSPYVRGYLLSRVASDATLPLARRRAIAVQAMEMLRPRKERGPLSDLLLPERVLIRAETVRFGLGALGPDDLGLCVQLATRAIQLAEPGDELLLWVAHRARAKAQLTLGDIAAADDDIRRSVELAERMNYPLTEFESLSMEGYRAQIEGRFDDAQRAFDRQAEHESPVAPPQLNLMWRLRTMALRDQRGVSQQPLDAGFIESVSVTLVRAYHFSQFAADAIAARMFLSSNRRDLALGIFQGIVERGLDTIPRDDFYLATTCDLAIVCAAFGDRKRAAELYDRLRPYVALLAVELPLHYRGPVAYFLGVLARTLGRVDAAVEHFEAAATINGRIGARPMLNWTRLALIGVLVEQGDAASRARASFLLEQGLASARELGMASVCDEFERLRSRLGVDLGLEGEARPQ